jgi:CubicO group peptidase (beta-lactamase class C family)
MTLSKTIIGIGSTSKAFTSAALGLVINDFAAGRNVTALPSNLDEFTWDTKLANLLPEDWKLMDQWASDEASVRDVLAHVSGKIRCLLP